MPAVVPIRTKKPLLKAVVPVVPPVVTVSAVPRYPDVTNPPLVPNCKVTSLVPFVETPLNINVMRVTHEGTPVKSMLVPEVDA